MFVRFSIMAFADYSLQTRHGRVEIRPSIGSVTKLFFKADEDLWANAKKSESFVHRRIHTLCSTRKVDVSTYPWFVPILSSLPFKMSFAYAGMSLASAVRGGFHLEVSSFLNQALEGIRALREDFDLVKFDCHPGNICIQTQENGDFLVKFIDYGRAECVDPTLLNPTTGDSNADLPCKGLYMDLENYLVSRRCKQKLYYRSLDELLLIAICPWNMTSRVGSWVDVFACAVIAVSIARGHLLEDLANSVFKNVMESISALDQGEASAPNVPLVERVRIVSELLTMNPIFSFASVRELVTSVRFADTQENGRVALSIVTNAEYFVSVLERKATVFPGFIRCFDVVYGESFCDFFMSCLEMQGVHRGIGSDLLCHPGLDRQFANKLMARRRKMAMEHCDTQLDLKFAAQKMDLKISGSVVGKSIAFYLTKGQDSGKSLNRVLCCAIGIQGDKVVYAWEKGGVVASHAQSQVMIVKFLTDNDVMEETDVKGTYMFNDKVVRNLQFKNLTQLITALSDENGNYSILTR